MPRQARLDTPGALHHVITRGITRSRIFSARVDYEDFLARAAKLLKESRTICYAWALMPNHVHLLLQTGSVPLAKVLSRLLTGYAVGFNRRHRRSGHLFQNRYKSILCDREVYFQELVRYIHLNPLRAGLVRGIRELAHYPWCGHGAILGHGEADWQDVEGVLATFGRTRRAARKAYEIFMVEGALQGRREELIGGGIVRSFGGQWEFLQAKTGNRHVRGDERILGSGEFVEQVLRAVEEREQRTSRLKRQGWKPARVIERAAAVLGIRADEVYGNGKRRAQSRARSLACKWLVEDLGMQTVQVARLLRMTQPGVSISVVRGRRLAGALGQRLEGRSQ